MIPTDAPDAEEITTTGSWAVRAGPKTSMPMKNLTISAANACFLVHLQTFPQSCLCVKIIAICVIMWS
ncbi:hypothetical protein L1887_34199 [Cichorium endivia]|nr:hypothetical protein L1887_34199 [Cichorium endivia]